MLIKTQGIVLKQRNIGESDKILTILTSDLGVIEASARDIKTKKSKLSGASQILSYSDFCLFKGKSQYIINSAESINPFYSLRLDVVKLSLAGYFCELICYLSKNDDENAKAFLKLILNSLHFLADDSKDIMLLKSIFELRSLTIAGFQPDLVCCRDCASFESESMCFFPLEGVLLCGDCVVNSSLDRNKNIHFSLNNSVLSALRFIVFSEEKRLFSFKLGGLSLSQLNYITENYAMLHTEAKFNSLDIFNSLQI